MSNLREIHKGAKVVEIGPGLGDLSVRILNHCDLIAYEIDGELCEHLKRRIPGDNWQLYNKDILAIPPSDNGWLSDEHYIVVSNLPYYIATKIILALLGDEKCRGMIVMTQKEVAEKFCANVGEREFCALSVIAQSASESVDFISSVPASAFCPAPKVESAIIGISKGDKVAECGEDFREFLRRAFSAPRKKLSTNLAGLSPHITEILRILGIDEHLRPHQVSTQAYYNIFKEVQHYGRQQHNQRNGK